MEYAQKIFGQQKDMRKTDIQGENVFGKSSHEPLTKAGEISDDISIESFTVWEYRPRRKKEGRGKNYLFPQCDHFLL